MSTKDILLVITGLIIYFLYGVRCHGYLQDPPSRSSMWRFGYQTPHNYEDNQLFCGGFDHQWNKNGGKCGICGDPYDGARENEAGGKYAKGIITKTYTEGSTIQVKVLVTAAHKGYFEFRICPNNNVNKAASQECLDRYVLQTPDGKTRYPENGKAQLYIVDLKLPKGLTCQQCVMQWKYNAGNSYGVSKNGTGCIGCGNQEQFYACADVAIRSSGSNSNQSGSSSSSSSSSSLGVGRGSKLDVVVFVVLFLFKTLTSSKV